MMIDTKTIKNSKRLTDKHLPKVSQADEQFSTYRRYPKLMNSLADTHDWRICRFELWPLAEAPNA
jgi:hypothetical protein